MTKLLILLTISTSLFSNDLKTTLNEVLQTNPLVLERLKNYNATKEDIENAKSGYYPKLDISIGTGVEKNNRTAWDGSPALTNPDNGKTVSSSTLSVYQTSLKYTQNIFAGFQTKSKIEQSTHKTLSAAYSYIEKVNNISFQLVESYLEVMRNKELLDTAKANVDINKEIFKKVEKLYEAGLTTLSEVNKIESTLSLAESNYVVQENILMDVMFKMQRILGRYLDSDKMQKPILNVALPATIDDAAQFAIKNNPSLLIAKYNVKSAQDKYKEKKSAYYPKVDIEVSKIMNSNLSGIPGEDDRFRAMAYLSYNLFNGFSDKSAVQKSISQIHQEVESKNDLRRRVIENLNLAWAANEKLGDQLEHLENYKKFSLKTLTLYAKEYDLGRRSLLDLLSAQNDFIGAKQQIINTQYSMLLSKYRILDSMGTMVSTILGDTQRLYSNVNLANTNEKQNFDSLPIHYDKDLDLISDELDLCNNSIKNEMRNLYGCKYRYKNTEKIDRYTGFYFNNTNIDSIQTLNSESENRLDLLIKQISSYGFEYLKFDIIGNVDDSDLNEEEKLQISQKRADYIKQRLINAGASERKILTHANSDKAPLYSNESSEGIEKNNRVDIIIRKLKKPLLTQNNDTILLDANMSELNTTNNIEKVHE